MRTGGIAERMRSSNRTVNEQPYRYSDNNGRWMAWRWFGFLGWLRVAEITTASTRLPSFVRLSTGPGIGASTMVPTSFGTTGTGTGTAVPARYCNIVVYVTAHYVPKSATAV